ncbi:hypothetical protein THMIRHAM_01860 [Thiomicrorhabdus immobilis]|uniref:Methyl-accepting chemotaxis protein n=1 Tax=Thiomicrorhabdus immobilis TaxID=2791037 RepID=A0ABM7MAN3_9GAMM|nr:methyl-accepting chemotaxis protein [Thiomicrorhabdus immobilis]BCN92401.1 hypothetical protein THMIRHAM_01860 [Thiomicrorhabdus immobilis]
MFSKLKLKQKILGALLLVGIIPFGYIATKSVMTASSSLEKQAFSQLEAVRDIKKAAINRYYATFENQLITTASNATLISATSELNKAFQEYSLEAGVTNTELPAITKKVKSYWQDEFGKEYQKQSGTDFNLNVFDALSETAINLQYAYIANNPNPLGNKNKLSQSEDVSSYSKLHGIYHPWLNQLLEKFGYYDIFLINTEGQVVYSVFKELDYATSLENGPWKDSPLAQSYQQAKSLKEGEVTVTDLALYSPSYNAPAGFAATPITQDGQRIGTLIFQLPLANITEIMSDRSGMGKSGETYLVGSDQLMRSESFLDPVNHSVIASYRDPVKGKVDTQASVAAIQGQTGAEIIKDYNGNPVLSAYAPVKFGSHQWAILAEIDESEAFADISNLENIIFISSIVILAIIVSFGLWLSNTLASPVIRLTKTMNEVGKQFDFSQRVSVSSQDEIGQMGSAFNNLLMTTADALNDVNQTMSDIAKGQFESRIQAELVGDLAVLKSNVNASAESVDNTMKALDEIMIAISNGDFKARMNQKVEGTFRNNVDNAMQSMDAAITELGHVIQQLSIGNFSARVKTELKGDLDNLKNSTNQSVDQLEKAMSEIILAIIAQSQGDLTVTVHGQYQGELLKLKEAYNLSKQKLNSVLQQVNNAANMVRTASEEVATGSIDLNDRTQNQAAALEETAASMEELTATIKHNTDNASTADKLSRDARMQAENGQVVMQESIEAISEVEASSKKIEEIIGLIDGIAFQTNLLALNAAVEAARAGEHGRGFAVVAGEVRNLAGKSAEAAKDIKSLIETTSRNIVNGSQKIEHTSESLKTINEAIQKVSDVVSEIAAASSEQQQGVEQVNQAITAIDQTTQQNAALVEETTSAAQSMSHESVNLSKAVSEFKLEVTTQLPKRKS